MEQSTSEQDSEEVDDFYRKLTPIDVDQALYTLKMTQTQTISSENEAFTVLPTQGRSFSHPIDSYFVLKVECDCCRLLRRNSSSRFLLPLARRGRPHHSSRSDRLLCSNCTEIKRQQQHDIYQNQEKYQSNQIYQTIINFDLSSAEQRALNNHQYQSTQMLVWKINTSDGNTIDLSYDTDSLTENEKKILLDDTIKKLQIVLNNRPIRDHDQANLEFTYRTLQTTINILSSSHNSI
jgi:hypothetical protein